MATTSKTLKPTNQTITLPDMTERPNNSVQVDSISKEADAINSIHDKVSYNSVDILSYLTRADGSSDNRGYAVLAGNVITVSFQLGSLSLSTGSNTIATITKYFPSWSYNGGTDPNVRIQACGFVGAGTGTGTIVRCELVMTASSSCDLIVYAPSAVSGTLRVTFAYVTSNAAL